LGKERVFIYPGSFDPVTYGHLDIITRASAMCDELIVAIGKNRVKSAMFTVEERLLMLRGAVATTGCCGNVRFTSFTGLLADYAAQCGAGVIVKGLRAMSDFEYEFQQALLNKHLDDRLETIFLMTNVQYTYLSSSAVKELAANNGKLAGLVPENVRDELQLKISQNPTTGG